MPHTGILAKKVSSLDRLVLGEASDAAAVVEATLGLVLLFKLDDGISNPIREVFGHDGQLYHSLSATPYEPATDGITAQTSYVNGRDTSYKVVDGVSDLALQTPCGRSNNIAGKFSPAAQLTVKTGIPIPLTGSGTLELWFQPNEFGTQLITSPASAREYFDIVRLRQGTTSIALQTSSVFTGTLTEQFCVRYNYLKSDGTYSAGDATNDFYFQGLQTSSSPYRIPEIRAFKQYHLVLSWDQTRATAYVNGSIAWDSLSEDPSIPVPPVGVVSNFGSLGDMNGWFFEFGQSGGVYDLVAVYDRKLSPGEILLHYNAANHQNADELRTSNLFADYAATHVRNARVSKMLVESLYSTTRNARITKQYIEVLRSVDSDNAIHRNVQQTLVYTATPSGEIRVPIEVAITQTLSLNDYATPNTSRLTQAVNQTLTFTQSTVTIASKLISQTLAFTQTVSVVMVRNRGIHQFFIPFQTVSTNNTLNLTVNQTLNFHENSGPNDVIQILTFSQTATGYVAHDTLQTLTFTQTVVFQKNSRDRDMYQYFTFQETAWINGPNAFIVPDDILSDHGLGDVLLGDYDDFAYNTNVLTFNQTVTLDKIRGPSVSQTLNFSQVVTVAKVFRRSITQTLHFIDGEISRNLNMLINGQQVIYSEPIAFATVIHRRQRLVTYQSKKAIITLPAPEWGDSEALGNEVKVKRAMNGKVYTYIKTAKWMKVVYDFTITRKKAFELRTFLLANLTEIITLRNWKGQVFIGQFLVNPIQLTSAGRYANSYEKITVTLEFEGVRVHG